MGSLLLSRGLHDCLPPCCLASSLPERFAALNHRPVAPASRKCGKFGKVYEKSRSAPLRNYKPTCNVKPGLVGKVGSPNCHQRSYLNLRVILI